MYLAAIGENLIIVAAIIGLLLLQFLFRRGRQPVRNRPELVRGLLTDVRINEALVETFGLRPKPRKFETANWQLNRNRLDFLGQSLRATLSDAFTLAQNFNQEIKTARKSPSDSHIVTLDVAKLKEPLAKSKQGLEDWLLANVGGKEPPMKYPGLFDYLFGGR